MLDQVGSRLAPIPAKFYIAHSIITAIQNARELFTGNTSRQCTVIEFES
jgi:hypothetical protein